MSEFQERLWSELVRDHAAALAYPVGFGDRWRQLPIVEPRGSRRLSLLPTLRPRRLAGVLGAIAAVAVAVTVATVTSSTSSAAYAVTPHPDGTITVTIGELKGVTGANAQLAKLGVPVRVAAVRAGCPAPTSIVPMTPALAATIAQGERQGILARPDLVPAGETLVLAARQVGADIFYTFALYRGVPPTCVSPGDSHAS
jgi:hypothetical protein